MIDFTKNKGITTIFTSLTSSGSTLDHSEAGVSSLMDTWIVLRMVESASERNRVLYALESRGMAHSNQMREFELSNHGIDLVDVYVGPGTVYTGTERMNQKARDEAGALSTQLAAERRRRELERERRSLQAQVAALEARIANLKAEQRIAERQEEQCTEAALRGEAQLSRARRAD